MFKDNKKDTKKKPKTLLRKIWYFIWEDDSVLSWIVNIVLAFILIKFLIYPGMGLIFGTTHPVVAVVSGSMEHKLVNGVICGRAPDNYKGDLQSYFDTCGDFYEGYSITQEKFDKFSFKNGFNTGDIIVLFGTKPADIKVGDVIVFKANQPDPIIHRVINTWKETQNEKNKYFFSTKGDHNPTTLYFENSIDESRLIGKAVFRIPYLGYIKIWFVELLKVLGLGNSVGKLF